MKKISCLLLALLLCICLLPPGAIALQSDIRYADFTEVSVYLISAQVYQGRILLSGNGLYEWLPERNELKTLAAFDSQEFQEAHKDLHEVVLASQGDVLYGLNARLGKLFTLSLSGDELSFDEGLDIDNSPMKDSSFGDEEYVQTPVQVLVAGERLYIKVESHGPMGMGAAWYSYDVQKGGKARELPLADVQVLLPYKEGRLLAQVMDMKDPFDPKTGRMKSPSLSLFDPQSDSLQPLYSLDLPYQYEGMPMAYDPDSGYILIKSGSDVHRIGPDGKAELCAYLQPTGYAGNFSGGLQVLPGSRLVYAASEVLALRSSDPADLPTERLLIFGGYMDDNHQKAMAAMSGISVSFADPSLSGGPQALAQMLVSGEGDMDIFILESSNMDTQNLMNKGYLADLSGSPALLAYADALYPTYKAASLSGAGQLMLLPIAQQARMQGYYPKIFDEVGMQVPGTFFQLVNFVQDWNDQKTEDFPDYLPLSTPNMRMALIGKALELYAFQQEAKGQPFSFQDPLLKEMLLAVEGLRLTNFPQLDFMNQAHQEQMNEMYSKLPLINDYFNLGLREMTWEMRADHEEDGMVISVGMGDKQYSPGQTLGMLLTIREGEEGHLPISLTLMAVNARSKNVDLAIRYLEAYAKAQQPHRLAEMMPMRNEPIEEAYHAVQKANSEKYLAGLAAEADKAEGAQKTQLLAQLEEATLRSARELEAQRWEVDAAAIQQYREYLKNNFVYGYGDLNLVLSDPQMQQLTMRYLQAQMPLDQFLSEAEGKLRLMRMENQ